MEELELNNDMNNNISIEEEQNKFLETTLGKTINTGLNIGLRYLLPDIVEDQVIEIKDEILENGFKDGVKKAIDSAIDLGKSAMGILTGNFENVSQVQTAIKAGGIIDSLSNGIDMVVNKVVEKGKISYSLGNVIKQGKNTLLNTITKNIENEFDKQIDSLEKINKYSENWTSYYNNKDFEGMEKEYNKIKDKLKDVIPMENTIKEARRIENLHMLIKNNGNNFNLSQEQIELASIL